MMIGGSNDDDLSHARRTPLERVCLDITEQFVTSVDAISDEDIAPLLRELGPSARTSNRIGCICSRCHGTKTADPVRERTRALRLEQVSWEGLREYWFADDGSLVIGDPLPQLKGRSVG